MPGVSPGDTDVTEVHSGRPLKKATSAVFPMPDLITMETNLQISQNLKRVRVSDSK